MVLYKLGCLYFQSSQQAGKNQGHVASEAAAWLALTELHVTSIMC
jgi:hypothetical protein